MTAEVDVPTWTGGTATGYLRWARWSEERIHKHVKGLNLCGAGVPIAEGTERVLLLLHGATIKAWGRGATVDEALLHLHAGLHGKRIKLARLVALHEGPVIPSPEFERRCAVFNATGKWPEREP